MAPQLRGHCIIQTGRMDGEKRKGKKKRRAGTSGDRKEGRDEGRRKVGAGEGMRKGRFMGVEGWTEGGCADVRYGRDGWL